MTNYVYKILMNFRRFYRFYISKLIFPTHGGIYELFFSSGNIFREFGN